MKRYKIYDKDGLYPNIESSDGAFNGEEARDIIKNTDPNGGYWIIKLIGFPFYLLYLVFDGVVKIIRGK